MNDGILLLLYTICVFCAGVEFGEERAWRSWKNLSTPQVKELIDALARLLKHRGEEWFRP